jgi:UPF0176 protein
MYKFVSLSDYETLREIWKELCQELGIRGTILLSPEGVNIMLVGLEESIREMIKVLKSDPRLSDLDPKESWTDYLSFNKLRIKLKKEIITYRQDDIVPEGERAPAVSPEKLDQWIEQGYDDDGRDVVLVDTRNNYEVEFGTFESADWFDIRKFTDFPAEMESRKGQYKGKTVVTFCTGGIRCEKAAIHLNDMGFHSYQLEGGILKYFEKTGGKHWNGSCFVFDQRVAVKKDLNEAEEVLCRACNEMVDREGKLSLQFKEGVCCPSCFEENAPQRIKDRNAMIEKQKYEPIQKNISTEERGRIARAIKARKA